MKVKTFEKKEELLGAALQEFTTKSYEEASLNTIIKNAGISKGTFYYHFADKQALYLYLLEASVAKKWEFINAKVSAGMKTYEVDNIFERFKMQAEIAAEFASNHPKYHELSQRLVKEKGNPIYKIALKHLGSDSEELLNGMIEEAYVSGTFREGYSKDFLVRTLSYLFTHFHEMYGEENMELNKMVHTLEAFVDMIRYGIDKENRKGVVNNE